MSGIDQAHLTNVVKIKGHSELNFANSSFLIDYKSKLIGCTNSLLFSSHFGIKPGVNDKSKFPEVIEEWLLCPRMFRKSLFSTKPILANEIKVKGYLNLSSPGELLLLDIEQPGKGYGGLQIGNEKLTTGIGHPVILVTCPFDQKSTTQSIHPGKVISADNSGFTYFALDKDISEKSVFGSPVLSAETGMLMGVVSRFKEFDGKRQMGVVAVDQIREDLKSLFGEQ